MLGHEFGVAAQQNVGASTGHVRRNRNRALLTGLRDDLGFLLVELGVQNGMLHAAQLKQTAHIFALFH